MEPPSATVKLMCGVYGTGNVFAVNMARAARVSRLQEAITDVMKCQAHHRFAPYQLRLYLARKDDKWLQDDQHADALLREADNKQYEEMREWQTLDLEGWFDRQFIPADDNIHILVEVPPPHASQDDLTWISMVNWNKPQRLCTSIGKNWDYQGEAILVHKLALPLTRHFNAWARGDQNERHHPVFLVMSGPGTGKSRMLEQMDTMLCKAAKRVKNDDLLLRMEAALKFHIAIDEGTQTLNPSFPELDISAQMLHQIWKDEISWPEFLEHVKRLGQLSISQVIAALARQRECNVKDMTVILCVDDLHKLPNDGTQTCHFNGAISAICGFLNTSEAFAVCVCSSTVLGPVNRALAASSQIQVFLRPPMLNGETILNPTTRLQKQLVEDMGGHGRALEVLQTQVFEKFTAKALDLLRPSTLITRVLDLLYEQFGHIFEATVLLNDSHRRAILAAVLSRRRYHLNDTIGQTGITVDELTTFGLFRLTPDHRVECPFILLLSIIRKFTSPEYGECIEDHLMQHKPTWQDFEKFCAVFRCVKSTAYHGVPVSLSEFHAGARFGAIDGLDIIEPHDRTVVESVHQLQTRGMTDDQVILTNWKVQVGLGTKNIVVLNASGASAGDVVSRITLTADGIQEQHLSEVIQCKMLTTGVRMGAELFEAERAKGVGEGSDVFLLITTAYDDGFELGARCGIVSKKTFKPYFGLFASRAYRRFVEKPRLNSSSFTQLTTLAGVGDTRAEQILSERPFSDEADARARLQGCGFPRDLAEELSKRL